MKDHGPGQPGSQLGRVMRMVPSRPDMVSAESVRKAGPGSNGTLRYYLLLVVRILASEPRRIELHDFTYRPVLRRTTGSLSAATHASGLMCPLLDL